MTATSAMMPISRWRTSLVAVRSVKASPLRSGASCFPGGMSAIGRSWAPVPWLPRMSRHRRRSSVYRHGRLRPNPALTAASRRVTLRSLGYRLRPLLRRATTPAPRERRRPRRHPAVLADRCRPIGEPLVPPHPSFEDQGPLRKGRRCSHGRRLSRSPDSADDSQLPLQSCFLPIVSRGVVRQGISRVHLLITGGAGFIGSNLAELALRRPSGHGRRRPLDRLRRRTSTDWTSRSSRTRSWTWRR